MTSKELSIFCSEIALLLEAAIPLDQGFYTMAADAPDEKTKKLLNGIAEELELGDDLATAMTKYEAFPPYVIKMAEVGQKTGNLDVVMRALSVYYEKEHRLAQTIKNAFTYPIVMVFILLLVFFVLFTKVMPIFEDIYEQVGTELSSSAQAAISIGGVLSGILLAVIGIMAVLAVIVVVMAKKGKSIGLADRVINTFKEKSSVSTAIAKRRFASVMALAVQSGLDLEEGLELAKGMITHEKSSEKIAVCIDKYVDGRELSDALADSGFYDGMDMQMIKVGSRAGKMDVTMAQIADKYEMQTDDSINSVITKFEPTMVAVLAIVVGLILFSVMMPLIGIMSSIG